MRANARMTRWLTEAVEAQLERARRSLGDSGRGLGAARNALVVAISMAQAAGAPEEDLAVLRATKEAIGESPAGDQLRELEARVGLLCQRAKSG